MTNFILRDVNAVFIHLPKTGGTSVQKALGVKRRFFGHIPTTYENLPRFSIVREPGERFLSAFRMFKYGSLLENDHYAIARWPDLTITEALDVLEDPWTGHDRSIRNLRWNLKHHLVPQTHPFNCLGQADHILRFETLAPDFKTLCSTLGIQAELPVLRKSVANEGRSENWTDEDNVRFMQIFENDYKLLGYSPEGVSETSSSGVSVKKSSESTEPNVYSLWSSYFSDRSITTATAAEALPDPACPLEPFADDIIPGKPGATWAGRSRNLVEHFHKLQPEFAGASRLSHLLASTIVVVRRSQDCPEAMTLFWRILDQQFETIRAELSLRWLVAISDTIVDFGRDPTERAIGMSASIFANSTKLHESELMVFYPKRPWPPNKRVTSGGDLFDGMLTYWTEKGDLIENMFARAHEIADLSPVAGKVLSEVTERLRTGPTVYRRFSRIFGDAPVPLADERVRRRMHRMMKKNL